MYSLRHLYLSGISCTKADTHWESLSPYRSAVPFSDTSSFLSNKTNLEILVASPFSSLYVLLCFYFRKIVSVLLKDSLLECYDKFKLGFCHFHLQHHDAKGPRKVVHLTFPFLRFMFTYLNSNSSSQNSADLSSPNQLLRAVLEREGKGGENKV